MKSLYCKWCVMPLMLLFLLFGGCEKEDHTLPVEFRLDFTIKSEAILGGSVTIDEVGLGLNSIDIRGYRNQGDDVFFTRSYNQGKHFIVKPAFVNSSEKFDIPQGSYNPIAFSMVFQPDEDEHDL